VAATSVAFIAASPSGSNGFVRIVKTARSARDGLPMVGQRELAGLRAYRGALL